MIFQCFVKVDKIVAYNTDDQSSTVYDLKTFVWDRFGIHPSNQTCKYLGRSLTDETVLKDRVQYDATVYITPKKIVTESHECTIVQSNSNNDT